MRILQVHKYYYRRAGAEAVFLDTVELLEKAGHEVAVLATRHPQNLKSKWSKYFLPQIDYDRSEGIFKDAKKFGHLIYSFDARRRTEAIIKAFKPDVAHLHNTYHHFSPSIYDAFRRHRVPVVQTVHDFYHLGVNPERSTVHAQIEGAETAIHHLLGRDQYVHTFITPSKFLANLLHQKHRITSSNIIHIPNPIIPGHYDLGAQHAGHMALFVGSLTWQKGIQVLFHVASATPNIHFVIAGSGQEKPQFALKNLTFSGFKSGRALDALYREARVVIFPSVTLENAPITILEAGLFGKPVIASRVGGVPEMITDNENGFLVTPGRPSSLLDTLRKIWHNGPLLNRAGLAARSRVLEVNDPKKYVNALTDIYARARGSLTRSRRG